MIKVLTCNLISHVSLSMPEYPECLSMLFMQLYAIKFQVPEIVLLSNSKPVDAP